MTVYTEKPAVNLREELASLRNQGGYQEQQFYFDGLVTNGTFDTDLSGWTNSSWTWSSGSAATTGSFGTLTQLVGARDSLKKGQVSYVKTSGRVQIQFIDSLGANSTTGLGPDLSTFGASPLSFDMPAGYDTIRFTTTDTSASWTIDNVFVFETDGTDVIHTMPKGWKPKDVFEDGLLQREGAANDYEVVYDGFDYIIKPTVAPSATTQTCVIGVKA